MVRQPIIAANWKLHKTVVEATRFLDDLLHQFPDPQGIEVVIAAPFTALAALQERVQSTPFHLAAQDLFWENTGAYTGEISAPLLVDVGCSYVIIGHSERRQYFGETDETVGKKMLAALQADLRPILCIGESLAQRQTGETFAVIEQQVRSALAACSTDLALRVVLAYEPLWAIGTGMTATPAQAQEVHRHIRMLLSHLWGEDIARQVRVQYGGSVKPDNIAILMAEDDIDGALVGGASLEVNSFVQILSYGRSVS